MSLFKLGDFTLHSGQNTNWIIDCNALSDDDLECLAHIGRALVGPFGNVTGIPKGGLRFAKKMKKYSSIGPDLIVDDVFTTGNTITEMRKSLFIDKEIFGLVIFSRTRTVPGWITPIFTLFSEVT